MEKITKNSTKKVGEFMTLKEARKSVVELFCDHDPNHWHSHRMICVYQEYDGTFSIEKPKIETNAKLIEAIDCQSGRRFDVIQSNNNQKDPKFIPKKNV